MKIFIILFVIFTLSITPALAQKKVAIVKLLRGEADLLTLGKTVKLQPDQWVEEGAVIKTSDKSFVKLIFTDKSQMNIGPHSEMKIESFSGKDSGVIDLVKGKIRSQVTKDYLQMEDKNKSKLFIKTANAVMGVRGTDFMISSNGVNSSVVLFEGEVAYNKLENRNISDSRSLENIVDSGVRMFPGEFSVVEQHRMPTVPALLNVNQREALEKNDGVDSRAPSNTKQSDTVKSVVPAGLNGSVVANTNNSLQNEVAKLTSSTSERSTASSNPDGYVEGDKVKPANGSFLHVESGTIIPPAASSLLDSNTNTYVGTGNGTANDSGEYVPSKEFDKTAGSQPNNQSPPNSALKPVPRPDFNSPDVFNTLGRQPNPVMDLRSQNQVENNKPDLAITIRVRNGEQ